MDRTATRHDFQQLSPEQQEAYARVLYACHDAKLSCRCEVAGGREFSIIVAPGLSAPRWWIDRLDVNPPTT